MPANISAKKMNLKLQKIKLELLQSILVIMNENHLDSLYISDIDMGCSPIIQEDDFDENNTYTLDKISLLPDNRISFDGSSSFANYTWVGENIPTDALVGILEFLKDHLEEIKEYAKTEEE